MLIATCAVTSQPRSAIRRRAAEHAAVAFHRRGEIHLDGFQRGRKSAAMPVSSTMTAM